MHLKNNMGIFFRRKTMKNVQINFENHKTEYDRKIQCLGHGFQPPWFCFVTTSVFQAEALKKLTAYRKIYAETRRKPNKRDIQQIARGEQQKLICLF